ncbi:MAG: enoyl-CoA hydratase/isomerase family protein [Candidatus Acidiferrales bacterium]
MQTSSSPKTSRVAVTGNVGAVPPKPEEFKYIRFRIDGEVARLTLERPEHNMLNERMLSELAVGIDSLEGRGDVKLIILDSAGQSFCGGIELGEYTPRRAFQVLDAFQRAFTAMLDTSKPLLVVVNGPAFGGGAELAALGDLVVATPRAKFAQPEIKLGVFPPLGAAILPYIVGPKRALELVLTGEVISAERALGLGLVNRVVTEAKLEATVKEMSEQVTAHSGAVLTMAKKAILGSMGLSLRDGVRQSMAVFLNELSGLEDSSEGLRAIAEKRSPQWKNR